MNAIQIARLMLITVRAYTNAEVETEEFTTTMRWLQAQADAAGFGEEAKAAYRQLCWESHQAQAAK